MVFEDDETLRMYVDESLEHLSDIENDLLSIEEGGADIDEELVNSVFRAAHSIKGGAGFMGLSMIKELAHHLENVLGMIRTRDMVPTPELISILLNAFDSLNDLVTNVQESNEADVSEHIELLIQATTGALPEEKKESVSTVVKIQIPETEILFHATRFDIDQAMKQGRFLYVAEYDMIADIQLKDKTPLGVINSLLNSGTIVESKVDFSSVGTLEDDQSTLNMPFLILFSTIIEPDMAPALVDLPPEQITQITPEMIMDAPGEDAPEPAVSVKPSPIEETETTASAEEESETEAQVEEVEVQAEEVEAKAEEVEVAKEEAVAEVMEEPEKVIEPEPVVEVAPQAEEPKVVVEKQKKVAEPVVAATKIPVKTQDAVAKTTASAQSTLRVNIALLDTLMTLAGELVLSRNQLMQGVSATNARATELSSQRIDMITSELQEAIMRTRMQPISNIFTKFTRVVRDLSKDLGKQIDLSLEGKEVELDKTIIEAINDPLTHLVRNSVDHGIESPDVRLSTGKRAIGKIELKAFHEAGQVNIEIVDDGGGIDGEKIAEAAVKKGLISEQEISVMPDKGKVGLIFLPGFSTAKEVTDVSGRGVGMDVVKTNLDKLGGIIDIESKVGAGTTIRIKLPLTLAIIPSQIISIQNERYAIPQVNLDELLRIPAAQVKDRIEKVGNADVVRLRGMLLPLLNLTNVLGIRPTFIHPETGEICIDKRKEIADRRSLQHETPMDAVSNREKAQEPEDKRRKGTDRRFRASSAINIAVVSAGNFKYGLVVDQLCDSEEIVVKPLGRHLAQCDGYAGATIMGDGKVALILDVASLARMGDLMTVNMNTPEKEERDKKEQAMADRSSLLLFRNTENEQFAAPLNLVERIERISTDDIEDVGGKKVIQYRGGSLPLHELSEVSNVQKLPERSQHEVIVFTISGKEVGLLVSPPVDAVEVDLNIDAATLKQPGIMGSIIIGDFTTLMVDMFEIVKTLNPEWFVETEAATTKQKKSMPDEVTLLFAEDSAFFRNQVKNFFEEEGFTVLSAEDGLVAWELLEENVEIINLVVTDLEMPVMDGFELTEKIKGDERYNHLSVIALTSLASESNIQRGKEVGIDSYEIKLDRERLVKVVKEYVSKKA